MKNRRTLRVLLVGAIGVGKSTVARIFQALGVPVFQADRVADELMIGNAEIRERLVEVLGSQLYLPANEGVSLNRAYLRDLLFSDTQARKALAEILYPHTLERSSAWFASLSCSYAVKESALALSAQDKDIDKIVMVEAGRKLCVNRVLARNSQWTAKMVGTVYDMQMQDLQSLRPDFRIKNDENTHLLPQIWQLHAQFSEN